MNNSLMTVVVSLVMVGPVAARAADAKDTYKIDMVAGAKGAVEFNHAKHSKEYKKAGGAALVCKDCHHVLKADAPAAGEQVAACQSCHVVGSPKVVGGKPAPVLAKLVGGNADLKSLLLHKTCKDGCHREMKGAGKNLTACTTCHK